MSSTITKIVTADELFAMPDDGFRYELVKGELIRMPPTGHEHGIVTMNIAGPLYLHVKKHRLGCVYGAASGFLVATSPDTVRAPDVAFISQTRIAAAGSIKSYFPGAPDLAIEVVSPGDTIGEIEGKVAEWLEAGTPIVSVISPKLRTVTVYRSLTRISVLTAKDTLQGEDDLSGFSISVKEIFSN